MSDDPESLTLISRDRAQVRPASARKAGQPPSPRVGHGLGSMQQPSHEDDEPAMWSPARSRGEVGTMALPLSWGDRSGSSLRRSVVSRLERDAKRYGLE